VTDEKYLAQGARDDITVSTQRDLSRCADL